MINYIVYLSNGKIIETGTCQPEWLASKAVGEDQYVMEGIADAATQKVQDGRLIDRQENDFVEELTDREKNRLVLRELRSLRLRDLQDSDWTQFADAPFSEDVKAGWAIYRQKLRDLPSTYADSTNIDEALNNWPEPPD